MQTRFNGPLWAMAVFAGALFVTASCSGGSDKAKSKDVVHDQAATDIDFSDLFDPLPPLDLRDVPPLDFVVEIATEDWPNVDIPVDTAESTGQGLPKGDLEAHRNLAIALTGDTVPDTLQGGTFASFGQFPQIADRWSNTFMKDRTRVNFEVTMQGVDSDDPLHSKGIFYYMYDPMGAHEVGKVLRGGQWIGDMNGPDWQVGAIYDFVLAPSGDAAVLHDMESDEEDPVSELAVTRTSLGFMLTDFHIVFRASEAPYGGQYSQSAGYPPVQGIAAATNPEGDEDRIAFLGALSGVSGSKHDPATRAIMAEWNDKKYSVVAEVGGKPMGGPEDATYGYPNGDWGATFTLGSYSSAGPCLNGEDALLYGAMLDWPQRYPGLVRALFYAKKSGSDWSDFYSTQPVAVDYEPFAGIAGTICNGVSSFPPDLNNAGKVVYIANISYDEGEPSTGSGLLAWQDGQNQVLVFEGNAAPGLEGNWTFSTYGHPVVNHQGTVAFSAAVKREIAPDQFEHKVGIWTIANGEIKVAAFDGMPLPNAGAEVYYSMPNLPVELAMNNKGQVAFWSELKGDVDFSDDAGIWVYEQDGTIQEVAREGTAMVVRPDEVRTPAALSIGLGSGGEDGRKRCINDHEQIVYHAHFVEGDDAIMLTRLDVDPDS